MRWLGNVASAGREELLSEFLWGNVRAGDHLKDLDEDGRIIIKRILSK
jgi:hypothetical protein